MNSPEAIEAARTAYGLSGDEYPDHVFRTSSTLPEDDPVFERYFGYPMIIAERLAELRQQASEQFAQIIDIPAAVDHAA